MSVNSTGGATPLAILTHAVSLLASVREIGDVVDIIRKNARTMIGCQGIAVIRREGDFCHYIEEDGIGTLWKGQKFPASACLSGWAMRERRTVVVPDILLEPRVPSELYAGTFVRAAAITPINIHDPIGAIGVYWASPYKPTRSEIEIVEALAAAAATATENIRLITALSSALTEAQLVRDELKHRVKNAYASAQSLVRLSVKGKTGDDLVARISALSRVHALLDDRLTLDAFIDIQKLIEIEMEPYRTAAGRYVANGPSVEIEGARAVSFGLAINELATNALKYGALSVEQGRVEISWSVNAGIICFSWVETCGPLVVKPERTGEGSGLLVRLVEKQLRGTHWREFASSGVRCVINFAVSAARPDQDFTAAPILGAGR